MTHTCPDCGADCDCPEGDGDRGDCEHWCEGAGLNDDDYCDLCGVYLDGAGDESNARHPKHSHLCGDCGDDQAS